MAILEVCGFSEWLVKKLYEVGCKEVVVIQPDHSSNRKTDQRDANMLGELLWNNHQRLLDGKRPNGMRRIILPSETNAQCRQLTNLKQFLTTERTKCINKIKGILRKHNQEQDAPAQNFTTKRAKNWLREVELSEVDRQEVNTYLALWDTLDEGILETERKLIQIYEGNDKFYKLLSIPGISAIGAITLLARIGDITRFKTPHSLANYFGLTPGCHNSGESQHRLGGITKAGSPIARVVLNHAVVHIAQKCPQMRVWYSKIRQRRGAKTARVAVMRKLATIIWHMLRWDQDYQFHYAPVVKGQKSVSQKSVSQRSVVIP